MSRCILQSKKVIELPKIIFSVSSFFYAACWRNVKHHVQIYHRPQHVRVTPLFQLETNACVCVSGVRVSSLCPESSTRRVSTIESMIGRLRNEQRSSAQTGDAAACYNATASNQSLDVESMDSANKTTACSFDHECPVCGITIGTDLSLVNSHIDECLKKTTSELNQQSNCLSPSRLGDVNSSSLSIASCGGIEECTPTPCQRIDSSVNSEQLSDGVLSCPVCGLPQPTVGNDLNMMNTHIDLCLNRDLLTASQQSAAGNRFYKLFCSLCSSC